MKPTRLFATLTLAAVGLAPHLTHLAQDPKPAPTAADTEKKVRKLLESTDAANMGKQVTDGMTESFANMPGLPDGFLAKFRELAKPDQLVERIVPIYVQHVDAKDLDAVIAFFESPVGRRWTKAQGPIVKASMEAGQTWGRDVAMQVMAALEEEEK